MGPDGDRSVDPIASGAAPRRPIRLRESIAETREVRTFRFERPEGGFTWRAGQNLVMTIPGLEDPRGPTRPFTISSSPTEEDVIAVSTLMRESPFKQRLARMAPGDTVEIEGPEGDFVLEPGRPAVMIAGGIGVTPFRSMLKFATDTRLEKPLILVYSSKTPADIVFRAELETLARANHAIRLLHTVTRPEQATEPWDGRKGRIDGDLLREATRGVRHPLVYVAGPPGLVKEIRNLLDREIHLSSDDIRTDEFEGY